MSKVELHATNIFPLHLPQFFQMFFACDSEEETDIEIGNWELGIGNSQPFCEVDFLTQSNFCACRGLCIWHVADRRDPSCNCGPRSALHILGFGIPRFAKVDVAVDESVEDKEVGGVDNI